MLLYSVSKNDADQLRDPCQKQICMECFLVLSFASGNTKAVFKVIDGAFHSCPDFISIVPFGCATQGAGICPQVFFWIDIDHPSARR